MWVTRTNEELKEWIGITESGDIAWAYASGCSCWDGDYEEERYTSMKEVTLRHDQHLPEKWEQVIISYAQNHKMVEL